MTTLRSASIPPVNKRSPTTLIPKPKKIKLESINPENENMIFFQDGKKLKIQVAVDLYCYSKYAKKSSEKRKSFYNSIFRRIEHLQSTFDFNMFYMIYPIENWNTAHVTSMRNLFLDQEEFNEDLYDWDTSNVTDMYGMFQGASSLSDQNFLNWKTSKVTTMAHMFLYATNFCGFISSWDTSNVTDMSYMFSYATQFNNNLYQWNTSNVTDMSFMFSFAQHFNGNLSNWKTENVNNMEEMFSFATNFNCNLFWNTSNVINMSNMFFLAQSFNGNLSSWDTSKVINMSNMFQEAYQFEGKGLSNWKTLNVTDMSNMFNTAKQFDEDITMWDVSNVTDMTSMFQDCIYFSHVIQWDLRCKQIENMFSNSSINELQEYNNTLPRIPSSIRFPITDFFEKCRSYGEVDMVHKWLGIEIFDIFIFYLKKKYNISCGAPDAVEFNRIYFTFKNDTLHLSQPNTVRDLANNFAKCIQLKNSILVAITIHDEDQGTSHSNVFFYRARLKTFEHFEPNGKNYSMVEHITPILQDIVDQCSRILLENDSHIKIKFEGADITCPTGFQLDESRILKPETEGYCLAWSYLVMELCLVNPRKPLSALTKEFMDDERFNHNPIERGKFLTLCVRGFVRYINDTYLKYFSNLSNDELVNDYIFDVFTDPKDRSIFKKVPNTIEYVTLKQKVDELLLSLTPNFSNIISEDIQPYHAMKFPRVFPEEKEDD